MGQGYPVWKRKTDMRENKTDAPECAMKGSTFHLQTFFWKTTELSVWGSNVGCCNHILKAYHNSIFFFMQWSKQFGLIGRQLFSLWRLMYSGSSQVVVPRSLEPRHPAGERKKIEDKKATPAFYKPWYRHDTHHIYSYSIGKNWIIYPQPDARRTWTYSPWPHSLDPAITPYYGRRSMTFWWKAGHLCH